MVARKSRALFQYDEGWTGGFYYMLNIVNALNQLPHNEKPELVIFYKNLLIKEKLRSLQYPFLSFLAR